MELKKPESLNKQEIDFCELFIFGCDPYAGNARKCYEDIFYDSSHTSLRKAKQLMARDDVQEYINQLRAIANYETADLKARLTEKLLHIIDENFYSKIYRSKRHRAITSSITFCSCASIKSFNGNVSSKGSTRK